MHFAILTLLSLVALQGAVTEDVCLLSDKQTFRLETPSGARPDGTSPSFCSPDGLTGHVSSFEQHWFFHREKIGAPWEGVLHAELDTPRMTGGWLERSGRWYYKPYPDYPTAVGVASGSIATLDAHTRIMYPHSMRALKQEEEQRFTANTAQEHIIKHIQACCDFGDVEDFRPQVSYFGSHRKASLYAYGYTDSPRRSRLWIHDLAEGLSHEVELGGDCGNRPRTDFFTWSARAS